MKAWKVSVKSDHSFWSFSSPESLYIWKINGAETKEINEYKDATRLNLKKGDTLIVEWLGTEYVYDDKFDETFGLKMIKVVHVRTDQSGSKKSQTETLNKTWISDELISLADSKMRQKYLQPFSVKQI